jgi:hypothetical protein
MEIAVRAGTEVCNAFGEHIGRVAVMVRNRFTQRLGCVTVGPLRPGELVTVRAASRAAPGGTSGIPVGLVVHVDDRSGLAVVALDPEFVQGRANSWVVRSARGIDHVWHLSEIADVPGVASGDPVWVVHRCEFFLGRVLAADPLDASVHEFVCTFPALDAAEEHRGCVIIGHRDFEAHTVVAVGIVVRQQRKAADGELLLVAARTASPATGFSQWDLL